MTGLVYLQTENLYHSITDIYIIITGAKKMVSEAELATFIYECMKPNVVRKRLVLEENDEDEKIEVVETGIGSEEFLNRILDDKAVLHSTLYDSEERDSKKAELDVIVNPIEIGIQYLDDPCPKCKKKKLVIESTQERKADEGQTNYYKCTFCNFRKKF